MVLLFHLNFSPLFSRVVVLVSWIMLLSWFLVGLSCFLRGGNAIKLRIRDKECYYKFAPEAGDRIYGSFVTHRPHNKAYYHAYVDLHIYDPADKLIYALERRDEYKFEFETKETGNYKFCLSIPAHSRFGGQNNDQYIDLMWELHLNRVVLENQAKESHIDDLWAQVTKLGADINFVKYEQSYQKARVRGMQEEAEQLHSRLKLFAILRSIVLVAVSVGQAYFLTRFIESRLGSLGGGLNRLGGFGGFVSGVSPASGFGFGGSGR